MTVDSPTRRARLDKLGVVVLSEAEGTAVVLADADQLESLARLRFEPHASDDADALVAAHAQEQPALATTWGEVRQRIGTDKRMGIAEAGLSAYPLASVAALSSIDDDADGLTNTEEAWWCTDPLNPNSDGDAPGYTDGQEVAALLDFTLSRTVRWGYGPPLARPTRGPTSTIGTAPTSTSATMATTIPSPTTPKSTWSEPRAGGEHRPRQVR